MPTASTEVDAVDCREFAYIWIHMIVPAQRACSSMSRRSKEAAKRPGYLWVKPGGNLLDPIRPIELA